MNIEQGTTGGAVITNKEQGILNVELERKFSI